MTLYDRGLRAIQTLALTSQGLLICAQAPQATITSQSPWELAVRLKSSPEPGARFRVTAGIPQGTIEFEVDPGNYATKEIPFLPGRSVIIEPLGSDPSAGGSLALAVTLPGIEKEWVQLTCVLRDKAEAVLFGNACQDPASGLRPLGIRHAQGMEPSQPKDPSHIVVEPATPDNQTTWESPLAKALFAQATGEQAAPGCIVM